MLYGANTPAGLGWGRAGCNGVQAPQVGLARGAGGVFQ